MPEVVVVSSPQDFGFSAPTDAVAAYFNGTLFMAVNNVTDATHAREAVIHEMSVTSARPGVTSPELITRLRCFTIPPPEANIMP